MSRTRSNSVRLKSGLIAFGCFCTASLPGCINMGVENPDLIAAFAQIDNHIQKMKDAPKPLERPLVVMSGYHGPAWYAEDYAARIRALTGATPDQTVSVGYPLEQDFNTIAKRAIEQIEAKFPSTSEAETIEVDVVGISMGGLLARAMAIAPFPPASFNGDAQPTPPAKRLRIKRLFTLASPHRGARMAQHIALDAAATDMTPGSAFLRAVNEAGVTGRDYELICYGRLRDGIVGIENTSPPGEQPIWVSGTLAWSHETITMDQRILADIARRLRSEEPLAKAGRRPPKE